MIKQAVLCSELGLIPWPFLPSWSELGSYHPCMLCSLVIPHTGCGATHDKCDKGDF